MAARVVAIVVITAITAGAEWTPARYRSGPVPQPFPMAVGGGEVFLELAVNGYGVVASARPLRSTPPFSSALASAVRRWTFEPARISDPLSEWTDRSSLPVASHVLVGAVFRPPALIGPTPGEQPTDLGVPSDDVPFPTTTAMPTYPPTAAGGGSVLVEIQVDANGAVAATAIVHSAPPFDGPALAAARQWRFRPAVVSGARAASIAYIVFGFPTPIVTTVQRDRG